jgi:hypothetical protein
MNIRLQYDLEFLGGIYYENALRLNSYSINLQILTRTADPVELNIAWERLKAFVYGELDNTVFINQKLEDQAEMLSMMGVNITTLPEDPVDQVIGLMLMCKLNAIFEGRLHVGQLDVSSSLGDNVWYLIDEEEGMGVFAQDGWWNEPTVKHSTVDIDKDNSKVVKVSPSAWIEYGLTWPDSVDKKSKKPHTVLYAKFPKNEN